MLTRRGFFSILAGAAALAVVPLELVRRTTSTLYGAWGDFWGVGDIIIVTDSSGKRTRHRITKIDGPTATVEDA